MINICLASGCASPVTIPSLDCPGLCLPCAARARERVAAAKKVLTRKPSKGAP